MNHLRFPPLDAYRKKCQSIIKISKLQSLLFSDKEMGWFGGEPETNTSATIDMSKYSTGSNFK